MTEREIFELLEEKYLTYCRPDFIPHDPISVPHLFEDRNDIEVSGLLTATIAWGQRPSILKNARTMMRLMGNEPYRFVMEHSQRDLHALDGFVHRTFNSDDLRQFVGALKHIYLSYPSLEDVFLEEMRPQDENLKHGLAHFRTVFLSTPHLKRTEKHIANTIKNSAAKRLNMYLRWMVRSDGRGVDFGIWNRIPTSKLSCPLDVHSGRNARDLGLLKRSQNDWKAVEELDAALRRFDPLDPIKYDFALFGMGAIN